MMCGHAVAADSATVRVNGVRYTLPVNSLYPRPFPTDPMRHRYEYMSVVVKGRSLYVNCVRRYHARAGDTVVVKYVPNEIWVNGKRIRERPEPASACP